MCDIKDKRAYMAVGLADLTQGSEKDYIQGRVWTVNHRHQSAESGQRTREHLPYPPPPLHPLRPPRPRAHPQGPAARIYTDLSRNAFEVKLESLIWVHRSR